MLTALVLALTPGRAAAHGQVPSGPSDVWSHWALEPAVLLGLAVSGLLYYWGLSRLWARAGRGRVVSEGRALTFTGGLLVLAAALLSPLDPLGEVLFSAHMVQHLLLILVAAPLLVLGAPEAAVLWALPRRWRGILGRTWRRIVGVLGGSHRGEAVLGVGAVLVATGTLWGWHLPTLYDLAVRQEAVHAMEHLTFVATAVLFWATVLRLRRRDHLQNGMRVLYVFAMALQGSLLGALITFAGRPLYESHAAIPGSWGVAPLADQQLAGLIMWVPPALLYVGTAAYLFVRWLEAVGGRANARESRASDRARGPQRKAAEAAPATEAHA